MKSTAVFAIEYMIGLVFLGLALFLPLSYGYFLKMILFILFLFFDTLSLTARHYSYLFTPMLKAHFSKYIVLSNEDPYYLSPSADSIIRKDKKIYIATVYVLIPVYISSTELDDGAKLEFSRNISRMAGLSNGPTRFTTQVLIMNKDEYITELKDAVSEVENKLAQLSSDTDKNAAAINHYTGKAAMFRNLLNNISDVVSYEEISYATVSASGYQEYEAVANAQQKARELISGIGAVFGVPINIITGEELLRFIEPEYLIPYTTITNQMNREVQKKVI